MKKAIVSLFLLVFSLPPLIAQIPDGFVQEVAYNQVYLPGGILFPSEESTLLWDLEGRVYIFPNDQFDYIVDIDITEEVARYGDLGLIGAAIHPEFSSNGYVYLFYCVDFHYLENFGTPEYDPEFTSEDISMGRITRYTVDPVTLELEPDSRKIILGTEIGQGVPICAPAHGVGALEFGEDGSLIATAGDGSTYVGASSTAGFNGEGPLPQYAYDDIALSKGIITPEENLGSFRSQYMDGLNGKVLRLNPETGEGLPGNPFFDESNPDSNRSKIWALGFRNPYRFTIKTGTGWGDLENGHPGTVVLSDVGDWIWEEVNFVIDGGTNFGWPMFQGPSIYGYYNDVLTTNTNEPNPLSSGTCLPYLNYQDIIEQENIQHDYSFTNPCNSTVQLSDDVQTFVHNRPVLSFANSANLTSGLVPVVAAIPTFDENGAANYTAVEDIEGFEGESFHGISGTGGVFIEGESIPSEYQNKYLLADYSGWLRSIEFDETNLPVRIQTWSEDIGAAVNITQNPHDQCIYVTTIIPSEVKRICFGGNLKPVLNVTPDTAYGSGAIEVMLDASESYDPEGGELEYEWLFDDGEILSGEIVNKLFVPQNSNIERQDVTLTVTDSAGAESTQTILISLNNTPPNAFIESIEEGELYSNYQPTEFDLIASVEDDESDSEEMEYQWNILLHHNTHFHYVDELSGNYQNILVYPSDCNPFESYWYEIELIVIDPGGLQSTSSKSIFPDCEGELGTGIDKDLVLYPNPTSEFLTILLKESADEPIELRIYDVSGRKVREEKVTILNDRNLFTINVAPLPQGVYILDLQIAGGRDQVKFVKTQF